VSRRVTFIVGTESLAPGQQYLLCGAISHLFSGCLRRWEVIQLGWRSPFINWAHYSVLELSFYPPSSNKTADQSTLVYRLHISVRVTKSMCWDWYFCTYRVLLAEDNFPEWGRLYIQQQSHWVNFSATVFIQQKGNSRLEWYQAEIMNYLWFNDLFVCWKHKRIILLCLLEYIS